jgi:polysaccharide deacetylase 2 family uncharacterized protein YibQ
VTRQPRYRQRAGRTTWLHALAGAAALIAVVGFAWWLGAPGEVPRAPAAPEPALLAYEETESAPAAGPSIESLLAAVGEIAPAASRPRIVVVIDDLGQDAARAREAASLPVEVVLAFLPYPAATPTLAREAAEHGHEILLHMPMEPSGASADPGPDALIAALSGAEVRRRLATALARVPDAIGVNNHMGSGLTEDGRAMADVMAMLAERGLYFLDSRTSARTVAWREAERAGVPWAMRSVFLDNDAHVWAVEVQLQRLEDAARRDGIAIGIGHPHRETLAALGPWAKGLATRGFELVPLSKVVRRTDPLVAGAD